MEAGDAQASDVAALAAAIDWQALADAMLSRPGTLAADDAGFLAAVTDAAPGSGPPRRRPRRR